LKSACEGASIRSAIFIARGRAGSSEMLAKGTFSIGRVIIRHASRAGYAANRVGYNVSFHDGPIPFRIQKGTREIQKGTREFDRSNRVTIVTGCNCNTRCEIQAPRRTATIRFTPA
jgi:hypothetical protein